MKRIYLDYAATTPVSDAVFEKMKPFFTDVFGNADSLHSFGAEGSFAIDGARRKIATLLNCQNTEVYFTSSGTESNNMALVGLANANAKEVGGKKGGHIIISGIEHASVRDTAKRLENSGYVVSVVNPKSNGIIDEKDFENAIGADTILASVMLANNEIGTIQPIKNLAAIAKSRGVLFHCDAVSAAGYVDIDVKDLGVDALSISAHKFYGCKGVGALYVKKSTQLSPLITGGFAERKMRGGTSFVAGIVSLAEAFDIAVANLKSNIESLKQKRDYLKNGIMNRIASVTYNGDETSRIPQNANFTFGGVGASELVHLLDLNGIAVSTGAACSSGSAVPSHVLLAIGLNESEANSSVRITVGLETTFDELDRTIEIICECVHKLRG